MQIKQLYEQIVLGWCQLWGMILKDRTACELKTISSCENSRRAYLLFKSSLTNLSNQLYTLLYDLRWHFGSIPYQCLVKGKKKTGNLRMWNFASLKAFLFLIASSIKLDMTADFCTQKIEEYAELVHLHRSFVLHICVLNFMCSLVAILGNILVIRALQKVSSIPTTLRLLLLSLAFSDLTVGLFAQLLFAVIIAVTLNMAGSGNFESLCPNIVTISQFSLYFLVSASCLSVAAIALDRLLAVSLHLRYRELVTPGRVVFGLLFLWIVSGLVAAVYILLPDYNDIVGVFMEVLVLFLTAVAYGRIYKVVRHHRNQIQSQHQMENQEAMTLVRAKRSSFNTFCVYAVLLACYLPDLCCGILVLVQKSKIAFLVAFHATGFLVFLNSSINPLIYYWRYGEIREIMKSTVKSIFTHGNNW